MNQIIEEQNIYIQYCMLLIQAEISLKIEQKDFEETFKNFIQQFTDKDKNKIIILFRNQFPGILNQFTLFQNIQPQSCIQGMVTKVAQKLFNRQKSRFTILKAYGDARKSRNFQQIIDVSKDEQFFKYMDFPPNLVRIRDIIKKLKVDGLKIWKIIEECQKPTLSININIFVNILFFVLNKAKLNPLEQNSILSFLGEATRDLIIQFQYLLKQQLNCDGINFQNYIQKLKQIHLNNIDVQKTLELNQLAQNTFIYDVIRKIAFMNFNNFLDYWFAEISELLKINSNNPKIIEDKVINAIFVNFEIQGQYLYFFTLFSLWYQFDPQFSSKPSHEQQISKTSSYALIPAEGNNGIQINKQGEKAQLLLSQASLFTEQIPEKQQKVSALECQQQQYVQEIKTQILSSPLELFQYCKYLKLQLKLKRISNYHYIEIFGNHQEVKRIVTITQLLSQKTLENFVNFLHDVFSQPMRDILYYRGWISSLTQFKIKDRKILLLIVFLYYKFDLEKYHEFSQQLEQQQVQNDEGEIMIQIQNDGFSHGMQISLEEFNLSLIRIDESEKQNIINNWVQNMQDQKACRNMIPFFFNIFKREEKIQDILSDLNEAIDNSGCSHQLNQKLLFQIFYNNANQELKVMLLKLLSRNSPIPLLFRRYNTKDMEKENFFLNNNAFYVFLESYTIINFSLSQSQNKIGKTDLINKIFYQEDKFEIRDFCEQNNNTVDIMFDYSFSGTRSLSIADCHHFIPLKILDQLLPLFKLWIIQVDGEQEIDEMLEKLNQLSSFEQIKQKEIILLIRNSTKNSSFDFARLTPLKIQYLRIKDLASTKYSKYEQEQEIAKVGNKIYSIIGQNIQEGRVDHKKFIQIIKKFNTTLNQEFQESLDIIGKLEKELERLVSQDKSFISPNAFPVRYLEFQIKQWKEQLSKLSQEQSKERSTLDQMIKSAENNLSSQQFQQTAILDLFCQIFQQKNYYILYLWFVDTIRAFNRHYTSKLIEDNQRILEQIGKYKQQLKQIKLEKNNLDATKIQNLQDSINDQTKKLEVNQNDLTQKYISIELFWREIIFQSKNRQLDINPTQIVYEMISKGEPFEFLDGDKLEIDQNFLEQLIKQFKDKGKEKILVLSVLGPQSSGKSTLLNKIFGCHFWTSVGRCTKGIYLQLLKIQNKKQFNDQFDYVLILDTEGLQSPNQADQEFDKRIALFVLAISDIILITIKGEITSQFNNLVQMCIFSLGQLTSISSLKQISWCFNQNHDTKNYAPFLDSLNGIVNQLNQEFKNPQDETEAQDYTEILGIEEKNIQILGFASTENKWKKDPKFGYYDEWQQYKILEGFSQEAYEFGLKIITSYSQKFQQQQKNGMMIDLSTFITNLCKQWDSIKRLPDLLEFSELIQHQENKLMKKQFDEIQKKIKIDISDGLIEDIKKKIQEKGKDITIKFFNEIQENMNTEAEYALNQKKKDFKNQLEKFKNDNKIQKKVFKKYESMIETCINSQLQHCKFVISDFFKKSQLEFQMQSGFFLLDKFVKDIKQDELRKLKNDHTLIQKSFDDIWQQIMDQQNKGVNEIFKEFAMQQFENITQEFSDCYLRSDNQEEFKDFIFNELVKEPPSEQDFEKIINKFVKELQVSQFVPIERNLKNKVFEELFYRKFKLKTQQKPDSLLQLLEFYKVKVQVFYVNQSTIKKYLKDGFVGDLRLYIQRKENVSKSLDNIVNEFFTPFFCFGVQYDKQLAIDFTKTLQNYPPPTPNQKPGSNPFPKLNSDKLFTISSQPILNQQSVQQLDRIKDQYVSLVIQQTELEIELQTNLNIQQYVSKQLGNNPIIHIVQPFVCSIYDEIFSSTFQFIQDPNKNYQYQNTFKTNVSTIIQKVMQVNNNKKWKQLYGQIHQILWEQMIQIEQPQSQQIKIGQKSIYDSTLLYKFSIPKLNSSRIRLVINQIKNFIQGDQCNKLFANFGIILNDIGKRCIYYFSLLVIWRLICYQEWKIESQNKTKLNNERDVQFKKFKADILENQLDSSFLRGEALAVEVYNNVEKFSYQQHAKQAQIDLSPYQKETCSSFIRQLDKQILEKEDPKISDDQIMHYIRNQSEYIQNAVNERIQQIIKQTQETIQRSMQQTIKKLLQDVLNNSKNLKDFSIQSMKAKYYFINPPERHEKVLFDIIIQCLQGRKDIQELKLINNQNLDAFSLTKPTPIDIPLVDLKRNQSDCEVQILKSYITAFMDKIQVYIQDCHKFEIDFRKLDFQNILDEIKLNLIGCLSTCPICQRKCDQDQRLKSHKHQCENGHQLRGMNGVLINNNPSLFMCEEISDESLLQVQESGVIKTWKEIRDIYNKWQFKTLQNNDLILCKEKMINIWNNKIGKMICEQLKKDLKVDVIYIPKQENLLQTVNQNIHYILILDSSSSMKGDRWQNVKSGVIEFMLNIQNNQLAKLTIIIFSGKAKCVAEFETLNMTQQQTKLIFQGGCTDFDNAFLLAYEIIVKRKETCTHQILFYTDGEADFPSKAIEKFKSIGQNLRMQIKIIACTEEKEAPILEQIIQEFKAIIKSAGFQKSVAPPEMGSAFIENLSKQKHQLVL